MKATHQLHEYDMKTTRSFCRLTNLSVPEPETERLRSMTDFLMLRKMMMAAGTKRKHCRVTSDVAWDHRSAS